MNRYSLHKFTKMQSIKTRVYNKSFQLGMNKINYLSCLGKESRQRSWRLQSRWELDARGWVKFLWGSVHCYYDGNRWFQSSAASCFPASTIKKGTPLFHDNLYILLAYQFCYLIFVQGKQIMMFTSNWHHFY